MIIGITGLPCSGSDTVGQILVDKGFTWLSYSDVLREDIRARGKEITRDEMRETANSIRRRFGSGELSKRLLAKMAEGKNYVVGTIRNPGEIEAFKDREDFFLIKIEAPSKIRFERMIERAREKDPVAWEEFLALEKAELGEGQPEDGLQIGKTMGLARHSVLNDSTVEELKKRVKDLLEGLSKTFK